MSGRQRWAWHRLEPSWAEAVVAAAEVRPGELVVDLGAGTGSLAVPLAEAAARVVAVELHPRRAAELRRRLAPYDAVVVAADLRHVRLPGRPFRVLANPPFAETAAVLARLADARHLTRADLVLQRGVVAQLEAGERRAARGLSARWLLDLPATAFVPTPPVDAALVTLRPRRRAATSARSGRHGRRSPGARAR